MTARTDSVRRTFLLALGAAAAAWSGAAVAQISAPRRYATMSLIGDMLHAIGRGEQTGSHMSRNTATEIKINGDIVDRAALGVVNEAIVKANPAAKPLSLLIDEPVLYEQQARLFDGKFVRMPLSLVKAAKDGGATHLLLLTKQRAPLSFQFTRGGRVGQGLASGLGFYVDGETGVRDLGNDNRTEGFLGLFVHVRATIVDLNTEAIVADRQITAAEPYLNTREGFGGLPWDALPPAQKVRAISDMLLTALRDNMPALLAA
jgi:hypothetical protein